MRQSHEVPAKKKPYQSPKLYVYGSLTQMTQGKGLIGRTDGGSMRMIKTG
jgi:hypothetical protein